MGFLFNYMTFLKPVVHEPIGKVGHDLLLFIDVDTHFGLTTMLYLLDAQLIASCRLKSDCSALKTFQKAPSKVKWCH